MEKIRVFEAFAGYGSQSMALEKLRRDIGLEYEVVGISEIEKNAITAYYACHDESIPNYGDISKIDWEQVPDFDLFTMSSPCFPAGTLVNTDKGLTEIQDITVGDCVISHDNLFHPIIKTMSRLYKGDIYRIKGMSSNEIVCTDEHPFYARQRYRYGHESKRAFHAPRWVKAKDLTKDDYLGMAINQKSELPKWDGSIDNQWGHHRHVNHLASLLPREDFWYLMGRYVGDGWKKNCKPNGGGIVICCSDRNRDSLISAIKNIGWNCCISEERTVDKVTICMNELHAFVDRYGYYAHGKHVDGETLNLPKNLLEGFLRGVMDSDGCYTNNEFKVMSVSRELIYGLAQVVAKVHHSAPRIYFCKRPSTYKIEGRTVNQRDTWSLAFHIGHRKQDKWFYEDGYIWFPISKIGHEYAETKVFNMSVSGSQSYTANGAIVHNCQDFSSAGRQAGGEEGSGTRSSLLWECRRAILAKRPKYILFENVPALVSEKFIKGFNKWQLELEGYGYTNHAQILNAKNYGTPQNRARIFMVSILGENEPYYFPKPFKLTKRLKDVLDKDIPEGYYLPQAKVDAIFKHIDKGRDKASDGDGEQE